MKKKICFFSGDITRSGGTERVSSQIANELAKDGAGEICFLGLVGQKENPFYPVDPAIPRYQLGDHWINPGPGYLPLIGKLRTFLKEKKIDIIVDIDIVLDVLSIPAAKSLGTKVISWEHFNADYELSVYYRKWILRYSVKRSDYVVVLTKADREVYRNRLGRRERIAQIYNPVDKSDEVYNRDRKKQILSVGRLAPQKGIDKLMKIAAAVLRAHPDWQWLLLGEGEQRAELEQFIAENNLHNRLILMGNVADVDAYLRQASLLVSTSVFEGLPMNLLEAKRMGVPCVSFSIIGPNEIIRDGVDGYLVTPFACDEMAERIQRLMDHPSLREQFSVNARDSLGEFEIQTVMKQWKSVLQQLMQNRGVFYGKDQHYRTGLSGGKISPAMYRQHTGPDHSGLRADFGG